MRNSLRQFAIITAALSITIAGFSGITGAVSSDGSFFFETFDGPATGVVDLLYPGITEGSFNAVGGTSLDVEAMVVDFDRQGAFFDYRVCNYGEFCGANEYAGELAVPLPPDTEFVIEVLWEIDAFSGGSLAGDANKDSIVSGQDLISVQQNFGKVGPVPLQGDANDSGDVTGADLISVQQNFGKTGGTTYSQVRGENAVMMSDREISQGGRAMVPRLEAKPIGYILHDFESGDITGPTFQLEFTPQDGNIRVHIPATDVLSPIQNKGELITIAAHNLGDGTLLDFETENCFFDCYDGTVDLYVNGVKIDNYPAGSGFLERVGNFGNASSGLAIGFTSALLHEMSVGLPVPFIAASVPEPGSLALLAVGGLVILRRRT